MLPGNLDPGAQEFRPSKLPLSIYAAPQCQPHGYYAYVPQTVPYCDPVCVAYPRYTPPMLYVIPVSAPATANAYQLVPPPCTAPTRTLLLSSVPSWASESLIRQEMEAFGEVRCVQMERVRDGIVTVHFYNLRNAEKALKEIREQHMQVQARVKNHQVPGAILKRQGVMFQAPPGRGLIAGCPVWAQFAIPATNAFPEGNNQGTIVVLNLDAEISSSSLKKIFQAYGAVKELRETPAKKHQKFIEFYDVRDAAKALRELNGKVINGKQVVIQFSRPGGYTRKFFGPCLPTSTYNCSNFINGCHENNNSSIESSVKSLSINGVEEREANGYLRRSVKKSSTLSRRLRFSSSVKNVRYHLSKGKQGKKNGGHHEIDEDTIDDSNHRDNRTTVMIKNIPNKYSWKLLLNMLDNHCIHCNEQIDDDENQPLSSYDFVYLPIDFNNKCNLGYGFVNMTSPEAALRFYKAFHHQSWEVFNSRKICEITYARIQGLEAFKEHFRNSKFPCDVEDYLPVMFSPPRDGRQLTEPISIIGHTKADDHADKQDPQYDGAAVSSASSGGDSGDEGKDGVVVVLPAN